MMRVDSATSGEARRASQARMAAWTCWAWETVATLPVPIAQTGSSAQALAARTSGVRYERKRMGRTGNDDLVPSVTLDNAGDRLELAFDDGHGLVGFALFEGFTDAGNDGETGVDGGLGLMKRF